MANSLFVPIAETEEEFGQKLQSIKDDIKYEFLNMTKQNRKGFFISMSRAFGWLRIEYNNTNKFRHNFRTRVLESANFGFIEAKTEEDHDADYIFRNNTEGDTRIQSPWFSDDGFKLLCMIMNKSTRANLVRRYFLQLEKDYMTLLTAEAHELKIIQKEQLNKLKQREQEYSIMSDENQLLEHKNHVLFDQFAAMLNMNNKLAEDNRALNHISKALDNNFESLEPVDESGHLRLRLYEQMYGKPTYLYLVNDKWLLKTLAGSSSKPQKARTVKPAHDPDMDSAPASKKPTKSKSKKDITETEIDQFQTKYDLIKYNQYLDQYDDEDMDFQSFCPPLISDMLDVEDATHELYFLITKRSKIDAPDQYKFWTTLYFFNDNHSANFIKNISNLKLSEYHEGLAGSIKNKEMQQIYVSSYEMIYKAYRDAGNKIAFEHMCKQIRPSN